MIYSKTKQNAEENSLSREIEFLAKRNIFIFLLVCRAKVASLGGAGRSLEGKRTKSHFEETKKYKARNCLSTNICS